MKKIILFAVGILFLSVSVFAWGQTGHRVVGEIAQNHITPKTLKAGVVLAGTPKVC